MNHNLNKVIKGYFYAHINEYNLYKELCDDEKTSYKKFKIKQVARYLSVPDKFFSFFSFFILLLSRFEILVYVLILLFRFFSYTIKYIFVSKKNVQKKYLMLGINFDKDRFVKILNSTNISIENIVVVKIPSINSDYSSFEVVHLFSGIKYVDLLYSFWYSIKTSFFMKIKYGDRDLMFRSYTSFEYFLSYFYLKRTSSSNEYCFISLIDRWAYLASYIEKTKCLIQHGILYKNMKVKKIGNVDYAYYINKEQKNICEKILLTNKPNPYYRSSIQFSSNGKLLNNEFKNVLLVCNKFFFDKEDGIIRSLSSKKVNLYIKPHPIDKDITVYKDLLEENDFVILEKNDYPKVDVLISYTSTLADEYESQGIKVLRYDDDDFDLTFNNIV